MRRLITIGAMFAALPLFGLAATTWSGTLLDANCHDRHQTTSTCRATKSTSAFLLDVNGTQYRLDHKSNYDVRSLIIGTGDGSRKLDINGEPATATITGRIKKNGKLRADVIAIQP